MHFFTKTLFLWGLFLSILLDKACSLWYNGNLSEGYVDCISKGERILSLGGVSKSVNVYHIDEWYEGVAKNFLNELLNAMKGPKYFNNDDAMTDYFSRSHYTDINVGKWNKEFKLLKESK